MESEFRPPFAEPANGGLCDNSLGLTRSTLFDSISAGTRRTIAVARREESILAFGQIAWSIVFRVLALDALEDLFAVHGDVLGRRDAKAHLSAFHPEHGDLNERWSRFFGRGCKWISAGAL
jgi:hypothetical protein